MSAGGCNGPNSADFDEDGHEGEITSGDMTAVVLFQAALPTPMQVMPQHPLLEEAVKEGEVLFGEAGLHAMPPDGAATQIGGFCGARTV